MFLHFSQIKILIDIDKNHFFVKKMNFLEIIISS